MVKGKLTPKSNDTVHEMRFSGGFGQPDGFSSVLNVRVNKAGYSYLTSTYRMNGVDHTWTIELNNEQRKTLAELLTRYEPTLWEEVNDGTSQNI